MSEAKNPCGFRDEYGVWHRGPHRARAFRHLEALLDENERLATGLDAALKSAQDETEAWKVYRDENERLRRALREIHEYNCGCDQPGRLDFCVAQPIVLFAALAVRPDGETDG